MCNKESKEVMLAFGENKTVFVNDKNGLKPVVFLLLTPLNTKHQPTDPKFQCPKCFSFFYIIQIKSEEFKCCVYV